LRGGNHAGMVSELALRTTSLKRIENQFGGKTSGKFCREKKANSIRGLGKSRCNKGWLTLIRGSLGRSGKEYLSGEGRGSSLKLLCGDIWMRGRRDT